MASRFGFDKITNLVTSFSRVSTNSGPTPVNPAPESPSPSALNYKVLDPERHEIRLLTFLPRDKTNKPGCTLHFTLDHASLLDPPQYTALSYCWGDTAAVQTIVVNGRETEVTTNLENALRGLAPKGHTCIWADAICINQNDRDEKARQVLLMQSIYRTASEVVAWLGVRAEGSDEALKCIEELSEKNRTGNPASAFDGLDGLLNQKDRKPWNSLMALVSRPYWNRVWILQEIAVGARVSLHCGDKSISWEQFARAFGFDAGYSRESTVKRRGALERLLFHVENIGRFRNDVATNRPIFLLEAIRRSSNSLATIDRDKVFALLGLCHDRSAFVPLPNYVQTTEKIFKDMAVSFIKQSRSLDIITLKGFKGAYNLPSWCPDWLRLRGKSANLQIDYLLGQSQRGDKGKYKTTLTSRAKVVFEGSILKVRGFHIATIDGLSSATTEPNQSTPLDRQLVQSTIYLNRRKNSSEILADLSAALTEISVVQDGTVKIKWLSAINTPSGQEHLAKSFPKLIQWWRVNCSLWFQGQTLEEWTSSVEQNTLIWRFNSKKLDYLARRLDKILGLGMRLMTTNHGYIGWAHHRARKGDKIVLLSGCSVPVLLRQYEHDGPAFFEVVGDAFMHGLMNGEEFVDGAHDPRWKHFSLI